MHDLMLMERSVETMSTLSTIDVQTSLGIPEFARGKVRDIFALPDEKLIFVATDRISAFDEVLGVIPGKGQVNTLLSEFWFDELADVIPNHMIAVPDPNVMIGKKLERIPIEVVVRGYMTGVTDTSIWGSYAKGERVIYGIPFRDGYQKNDKLDEPIITPTTKEDVGHDQRLTEQEIMEGAVAGVTADRWKKVREASIAMFARAQEIAWKRGYILVDTKMEFGVDNDGNVYVIDELFTPDSSRFWKRDTYEAHHMLEEEPENFDKEYLRLALKALQAKKLWQPGSPLPEALRMETARRYITLYEGLTGNSFSYPALPIDQRIQKHLREWLEDQRSKENKSPTQMVAIVMGSEKDMEHAKKISGVLEKFGVSVIILEPTSAHKKTEHTLDVAQVLNNPERDVIIISVAGRSDALSGVLSGNTVRPVIACPPPDAYTGNNLATLFSSMNMPSQISVVGVMHPEAAALHAAKIFALTNPGLRETLDQFARERKGY